MTPERAKYLLSIDPWNIAIPYSYREKWMPSSYKTNPNGITEEENEHVLKVFLTMPTNATYRDAMLAIARGER